MCVQLLSVLSMIVSTHVAVMPGLPCAEADVVIAKSNGGTLIRVVSERSLDALRFFEDLVANYRMLERYSDETNIVQVTRQDGEEREHRVETRVHCNIEDGRLNVKTPGSQARFGLLRHFGLSLPTFPPRDDEEDEAILQSRYDLWLVPHMTMRFLENPLSEFRAGVPEGFTATEAAPVILNDKPMVHLELKSGNGLGGDYTAKFDLYVDPKSMLIERIEGQQRLPDGADLQTTLDIRPTISEMREPPLPAMTKPEPEQQETRATARWPVNGQPSSSPACSSGPLV